MSKYYEVRKRDGAARIGRLSRDGDVQTPLIIRVENEEKLEVATAEEPNVKALSSEETWNAPRGAVLLPAVHPRFTGGKALLADFFVLSFASTMLSSPVEFVRRIIDARNMIPPDAALWVPAIATVENAALLFYMGVDIIDDANAVIKGCGGMYQLEEGEVRLNELEELPCTCSVCTSLRIEELRGQDIAERGSLIAKHNTLLLEKEVKKARERIRAGTLREYVEMKVRTATFLTAVLRILDTEEDYFERRTPVARNHGMNANTMESLKRVEVKRFAKRVLDRYEPPTRKVLLLLPCSARKPYSTSPTHAKFIEAIGEWRGDIHELILTSPLGVVPRELEVVYPAAFYDLPVTGYWDAEEREWVSSCLRGYLKRNVSNYDAVVAHISGAYKEICTRAAADLGVEVMYTCEESEEATSKEALKRLNARIAGLCGERKHLSRFEQKRGMIKAMADYQFGIGAGSELVAWNEGERIKITGTFPRYTLCLDREVLARTVPEYGTLALTVSGARRISRLRTSYNVEIGDFVPKGSLLAPGVVNADPQIRENDEVFFTGTKAFGVGRAKMSGWEMVQSRKGVAVQVREVG
jgi:archaeosine synthase